MYCKKKSGYTVLLGSGSVPTDVCKGFSFDLYMVKYFKHFIQVLCKCIQEVYITKVCSLCCGNCGLFEPALVTMQKGGGGVAFLHYTPKCPLKCNWQSFILENTGQFISSVHETVFQIFLSDNWFLH